MRRLQRWQKYRLFMAAALILFMTMLWSTSPAVVIPLSIAMAGLIIWTFFWIRRNPDLRRRTKIIAWFYLVFVLICGQKPLIAVVELLPHPQR
jgi:hypothetical protein